jgi:polyisoprenoid-binding protein YceI
MFAQHLRKRAGLLALAANLYLVAPGWPVCAEEKPAAKGYEVDIKASRIFVKVDKSTRLGHQHGIEGRLKSGHLTFGGAGELVFDVASFTADTEEARRRVGLADKPVSENEARHVTDTLRSAKVLDVAQFPTAAIRASSVTPLDKQTAGVPGMYQLEGRFHLHGAERKIRFKAKAERGEQEGTLRLTDVFTVKQTDYGIKPFSAAGGLFQTADELEFHGDLVLRPTSGK